MLPLSAMIQGMTHGYSSILKWYASRVGFEHSALPFSWSKPLAPAERAPSGQVAHCFFAGSTVLCTAQSTAQE